MKLRMQKCPACQGRGYQDSGSREVRIGGVQCGAVKSGCRLCRKTGKILPHQLTPRASQNEPA